MIKRSTLLDLCFAGIALIVFSNLNGVAYMILGVSAAFSSFILVFCLIIIYYLFRYKKITLPHHAFNIMIITFLIIGTASWMFYSHMHSRHADYYDVLRKHGPPIVLIYAIYKYIVYASDRGKLIHVLYFIAFALTWVTLLMPLDTIFDFLPANFYRSGSSRGSGLFGNPNLAGMHANFTLCFVLFFIVQSKRFSLLFLGLLPFVLYAGFLTFSKATIIIQILITVTFFFYNSALILQMRRARRRRFGLAILIILIGFIYAFPSLKKYSETLSFTQMKRLEQIGQLASGQLDSETTTHRSVLWGEALELIAKQPFIGHGTGCFHNLPEGVLGCHNTYMMIWGEAGIIPFVIFLVYIFSVYYRGFYWIRDPAYRFLVLTLFATITVQFYGSAHNGLTNSEINSMLGIIFALIATQRGRIDHLRYGKYVGQDYPPRITAS